MSENETVPEEQEPTPAPEPEVIIALQALQDDITARDQQVSEHEEFHRLGVINTCRRVADVVERIGTVRACPVIGPQLAPEALREHLGFVLLLLAQAQVYAMALAAAFGVDPAPADDLGGEPLPPYDPLLAALERENQQLDASPAVWVPGGEWPC